MFVTEQPLQEYKFTNMESVNYDLCVCVWCVYKWVKKIRKREKEKCYPTNELVTHSNVSETVPSSNTL
jgi:hypothetical protein